MNKRKRDYIKDDVKCVLKASVEQKDGLGLNDELINQGWIEALEYVSKIIQREEHFENEYVTRNMLDYWLGDEDPKNVLLGIANSILHKEPYNPDTLHSDIMQTWMAK